MPAARQPIRAGASEIQLDMAGNFGAAATEADIQDIIGRFAQTAALVKAAGLDGVQVHSAHGYLLSQFLSPRTNRRQDHWGGSLANRARLLLEVIRAVRARVGPAYPISVKLNSSDFVKGGFTLDESIQVVQWLNDADIDLLEVSGGTYEQLEFFKPQPASEIRDSTREREAMFLEYAKSIKAVARMPVMVTGGFRTRAGMEAALAGGHTDMIGLARPFCLDPDFPARMFSGQLDRLPARRPSGAGQGVLGTQQPRQCPACPEQPGAGRLVLPPDRAPGRRPSTGAGPEPSARAGGAFRE
jgi:2,4-dienoyl-CoA reductase-like NADH-dependent reductase (Old Yellow Enzyme family)